MCSKAVSVRAVVKSTKNNANGRNIVDAPKPTMVPPTEARYAKIKKRIFNILYFARIAYYCLLNIVFHGF